MVDVFPHGTVWFLQSYASLLHAERPDVTYRDAAPLEPEFAAGASEGEGKPLSRVWLVSWVTPPEVTTLATELAGHYNVAEQQKFDGLIAVRLYVRPSSRRPAL